MTKKRETWALRDRVGRDWFVGPVMLGDANETVPGWSNDRRKRLEFGCRAAAVEFRDAFCGTVPVVLVHITRRRA